MRQIHVKSPQQIRVMPVSHTETDLVLKGYALLQEVMGTAAVEDLGSFMETVSPLTDPYVVPRLVCACNGGTMLGIVVGAYLRKLNMGFIAYSGVKESFRRQGVYTAIRNELVQWLKSDAGCSISHIISELDGDGWLYSKYLCDWGAFALPCNYEQPEAQGLRGKPMKLVLQPLAGRNVPDGDQIIHIIREVYQRIYRIPDVENNPAFRRIIASIKC